MKQSRSQTKNKSRDNIEITFDSNDGVDGETLTNHINK